MSRLNRQSPPAPILTVLPCLRCAKQGVSLALQPGFDQLDCDDLWCQKCSTPHYLRARKTANIWHVIYERDTRRYPAGFYDGEPDIVVKFRKTSEADQDDDAPFPNRGPIFVFKRRRHSQAEKREIWLRSAKKCHVCGKKWKFSQHGSKGWHIDHDIPNSGGGKETEMIANYLVACASCNLKKGRGYTRRTVHEALASLFH